MKVESTMLDITAPMLDITAPQSIVEVLIRKDGHVLWVNIDGVCRLRVSRISHLEVEDHRVSASDAG